MLFLIFFSLWKDTLVGEGIRKGQIKDAHVMSIFEARGDASLHELRLLRSISRACHCYFFLVS